jgi:hypothetical protein
LYFSTIYLKLECFGHVESWLSGWFDHGGVQRHWDVRPWSLCRWKHSRSEKLPTLGWMIVILVICWVNPLCYHHGVPLTIVTICWRRSFCGACLSLHLFCRLHSALCYHEACLAYHNSHNENFFEDWHFSSWTTWLFILGNYPMKINLKTKTHWETYDIKLWNLLFVNFSSNFKFFVFTKHGQPRVYWIRNKKDCIVPYTNCYFTHVSITNN